MTSRSCARCSSAPTCLTSSPLRRTVITRTTGSRRWRPGNSGTLLPSPCPSITLTTASIRREPKVKKVENPKFKEEEEAVSGQVPAHSIHANCIALLQLRKRFTEQVKMEEARFRQWGSSSAVFFQTPWLIRVFIAKQSSTSLLSATVSTRILSRHTGTTCLAPLNSAPR